MYPAYYGKNKFSLRTRWALFYLCKILTIVLFLFSISSFDPFGLASSTSLYSKTLFYQWTAESYKDKESPVSVVILRDESFSGTWPVKAIFHAEILENIYKLNPKAVFVDFAFIDDRKDQTIQNDLIPVIKQYDIEKSNHKGIENTLYFLTLKEPSNKTETKQINILPEINDTRVNLALGPTEDIGFPGLRYSAEKTDIEINKSITSVAFEIYNDFEDPPLPIEDMEIVWKVFNKRVEIGKKGMVNNGPYRCVEQSEGVVSKIMQWFFHWFPISFSNFFMNVFFSELEVRPFRQLCPPIPTLDAHHLLSYIEKGDEDFEEIKKLIEGKFVFYGADLDAINDIVYPPTHKNIPGVYFNAMALDNLVQYKNNYIRHPYDGVNGSIQIKKIIDNLEFFGLIVLVMLTEFFLSILNRNIQTRDKQYSYHLSVREISISTLMIDAIIVFCYLSISFLFLWFLVWVGFYYWHVPPVNFIGLATLIGIRSIPTFIRVAELMESYLKCFFYVN